MAKRKGGDEPEESYDFIPPDFDEDGFIHKEMVSFRTTSTLVAVGILSAIVSWLVFPAVGEGLGWWVGLLIAAAGFAALKPLYKVLKFDISHYGRREWMGNGFLMFFTWLAFFMILLNPPFSDHAAPTVDIYTSPNVVQAGDELVIDLFVRDNSDVEEFSFLLSNGTAQLADQDMMESLGGGHYRYRAIVDAGAYSIAASGLDGAGHETTVDLSIEVLEDVIDFDAPPILSRASPAVVTLPDELDVYAVYADKDGALSTRDDRVWFQFDEAVGGWRVNSNFAGWNEGENTFTLVVEEKNRFQGQTLVPGGILTDGPHTLDVENPGEFTGGKPKKANPTTAPPLQVPGLEAPLAIIGLAGVALVARRK